MTSTQTKPVKSVPSGKTAAELRAEREKRRAERDKRWAERRLKSVGKQGALDDLSKNRYTYTPFEMSLLLNPENTGAAIESGITRVARVIESARNMLVILPLTLTWLSLGLAAAAYQKSLTAPKPNSEPFLQQWQEGFPAISAIPIGNWHISLLLNHERWFTFENFALTDASILLLLLLLTIVAQTQEVWGYQRGIRLTNYLERYLYDLNRQVLFQPEIAPDEKLPPWLRELRTDLGHLGEVIQKMNVGLDESLGSYTEALTQQREAVADLVEDTNRVHDSVVLLRDLFQGGAEAARIYQRYIPSAANDFATMTNAQVRSTEAMQQLGEMLARVTVYLARAAGEADPESALRRYRQIMDELRQPYQQQPAWQFWRQRGGGDTPYRAPSSSRRLDPGLGSVAAPRRAVRASAPDERIPPQEEQQAYVPQSTYADVEEADVRPQRGVLRRLGGMLFNRDRN